MSQGRYSLGGVDLPESAIVTSGDGEVRQLALIRAVEADEWEVQGDGRAVPQELVLEFGINAVSEAAASAQASVIWSLALAASQLDRDDRAYRRLLTAKSLVVVHQPGNGTQHRCTLTLLPKESFWRTQDGGHRLF